MDFFYLILHDILDKHLFLVNLFGSATSLIASFVVHCFSSIIIVYMFFYIVSFSHHGASNSSKCCFIEPLQQRYKIHHEFHFALPICTLHQLFLLKTLQIFLLALSLIQFYDYLIIACISFNVSFNRCGASYKIIVSCLF